MRKNKKENLGIQTLCVHGGEKADPITGAVAPVLVRTKTYKQKEFGKTDAPFQYSRAKNPTRSILEEKLQAIEGGDCFATVFGSGVAAEATLLLTLCPMRPYTFLR